jgi:hypothetical protein
VCASARALIEFVLHRTQAKKKNAKENKQNMHNARASPHPTGVSGVPAGGGRRPSRAASLRSHPLTGSRSRSPSAGRKTPNPRSRDASPVRLPSLPPAAAAAAANADATPHHAEEVFPPPSAASAGAHVASLAQYREMYARSLADPAGFWGDLAAEFHWETPWDPANFTR